MIAEVKPTPKPATGTNMKRKPPLRTDEDGHPIDIEGIDASPECSRQGYAEARHKTAEGEVKEGRGYSI